MDKQEILDYVMNTPGNTNRAVLSSMLNSVGSGSGSGGDSDFIIHAELSYNIDESGGLELVIDSIDKTFDEVNDAYNSGKIPRIIAHYYLQNPNVDRYMLLNFVTVSVPRTGDFIIFSFQCNHTYINDVTLELEVCEIDISSDSENMVYGWVKTAYLET